MRLQQRGRTAVLCRGKEMQAAVRPLAGLLTAFRYGQYVQDMLRVLLPWGAQIAAGDQVQVQGNPYVCVHVRTLSGHIQADLRRCAK